MWLITAILVWISIRQTVQLDCFNCQGIDSIDGCHTITTCHTHQGCPQTISPGPVGRSVANNVSAQCLQCCIADGCNKQLCKPSAAGTGCHDDPSTNCDTINQLFNICHDVQNAKLVCRRFCGLCDLVDGHWSDWSSWSDCSVTCESGQRLRGRSCSNPAPAHGGLSCPGNQTETKPCTVGILCPVDGGWSSWSPWQPCSTTCAAGLTVRSRNCSNPYPALFGQHCFGDFHDYALCMSAPCAVNSTWSAWSQWSGCSVTCHTGSRTRSRVCANPIAASSGIGCHGNATETTVCQLGNCPVDGDWSSWATWSVCSATCGSGFTTRERNCSNPLPSSSGRDCVGDSIQYRPCHTRSCPAVSSGTWGSWETWSSCDVTCGYGSRQRSRSCTNPGNYGCAGQSYQMDGCRIHQCPMDGEWTVWGSWSGCPSEFVIQRIRIRLCVGPFYGGTNCTGANSATKTQACS